LWSLNLVKVAFNGLHEKRQKDEIGNCIIWNKFHNKDVYWNKYYIKVVNMSCKLHFLFVWYFIDSLGIKNGKQLMKRNTWIIANWVLKLKIKISSKYYVQKLTRNDGSKCRNLESFVFKNNFLLPESSWC
jgi:hypothetical protein